VGALRYDQFTAPCVLDGPINGTCFRSYVEQQLVPTLRPGDIVIMDNLGSHKSAAIRNAIRAAGARLWFLPPYSPDLNPIEQAFAKIKHWMRQPKSAPSKTLGATSVPSSQPSHQTNAKTTSQTKDMLLTKTGTALDRSRCKAVVKIMQANRGVSRHVNNIKICITNLIGAPFSWQNCRAKISVA
jgi:transposase